MNDNLSPHFFRAIKFKNKSNAMSADHYHSYHELLYVTSGQFRYFIADRSLSVSASNIIMVKRNTIHKAIFARDTTCTYYLINFSEDFIEHCHLDILNELFTYNQVVLQNGNFLINLLFSKICNEAKEQLQLWERNIYHQLNELIISLYRLVLTQNPSVTNTFSPIEQSARFINECIRKQDMSFVSLEHISARYHFSSSNFSKKFKKETGMNFKQYVIMSQVLYAQNLIDTTSLPITEIAFLCGFSDSNYFSVVFKRVTKVTPSEYASYSRKKG